MAIVELTVERVVTRCAHCGATVRHAVAALCLGTDSAPGVIAVPACDCGAMEFLQRTWDTLPDAPPNHHRCVVNALAQRLIEQGQSHPAHASAHAAERDVPPDMLALNGTVIVYQSEGE